MRKKLLWIGVSCAMGLSLAACTATVEQQEGDTGRQGQGVIIQPSTVAEEQGLAGVYDSMEQQAQEWAPEIRTLEDGTQIQLTPDSGTDGVFSEAASSYNTKYLHADDRGCESCHQNGLEEVLENMDYQHWPLDNGLNTNIDVQDCQMCHDEHAIMRGDDHPFGTLIHGIHSTDSFTGNCMSCHNATDDGNQMQLWEEAKYDVLAGILPVADVQGDFSYEQDVAMGDLGMTWWPHGDKGSADGQIDSYFREEDPDTSVYETWEITVSGMVDNPFSMTLAELIEQAPSETFFSSAQCNMNPPTGEFVANAEVTGIPLTWFLEQAGVQDGATAVEGVGSDGSSYENSIENIETEGGWLIYQANGEPLSYYGGFPCRIWYPDHGIANSARFANELIVSDVEVSLYEGNGVLCEGGDGSWVGDPDMPDVQFANKPNVAVSGTPEGKIIPVGEAYEFQGYADAFDEQVVALEFSMDNGETWTRFDTSDSDKKKWVWWHFTFTPEESGAYVLSVRAVTDEGRVSPYPDQVMVNAK